MVLLAEDVIFVIEFKIGSEAFTDADRWQALAYGLDLRDYHEASKQRAIIPILVATEAKGGFAYDISDVDSGVVYCHSSDTLASGIAELFATKHDASCPAIDPETWINSPYRPSLTIIEAAETLFQRHSVREISHGYADNLSTTTETLLDAIRTAQSERRRIICFVTGVPGAGKTLTGLSAVHNPTIRQDGRPPGVFLSGNGPLVKIVSAALARCTQEDETTRERERLVRSFIYNVHSFLKEHLGENRPAPAEHVVIFDEAQRAWDARQFARKNGINRSEASLLLDVMSRCADWSVVIALVGGGQEIHDGEAGLAEWGRAIVAAEIPWDVWASPEAMEGGTSVAGSRLFANVNPLSVPVRRASDLHLHVSVRSPRAQHLAEWVNYVLAGDANSAARTAAAFGDFPMAMTRDLDTARKWLCDRRGEDRRAGLLASSGAIRHRRFGIEVSSGFRRGYNYADWFLNDSSDPRSSSALEVAATEFEVQGLELDWTCVCWASDFCRNCVTNQWEFRSFRGKRWQRINAADRQTFLQNKYRVLLTRAREGMVIWVPRGLPCDPTLSADHFDGTADFLRSAGIRNL